MNRFLVELDLEGAVALHLALGAEDGRLVHLRKNLLDYLYEQLSIEELEEIERMRASRRDARFDRRYEGRKEER
ncbi:MAG TPA: hypothetical protein VMV83_07255 [Rectinemataceae bacterium]|nr:hypothetical protein [Rectinemataceae bacterium]